MDDLIQNILEGGGITLTWLGMGTVFFCLSLLFLFFAIYGFGAERRGGKESSGRVNKNAEGYEAVEGLEFEPGGIPGEISAVIAMALQESLEHERRSLAPVSAFEFGTGAVSGWRIAGRVSQHARSKFWER
jgi:Na+-transporting methylmalonyl-CoA/oxaloacetate decarboxylase gamma subunit